MDNWRACLLLLPCLAGCSQSGICTVSLAATLPITLGRRSGRIVVPATVGEQQLSLLVDTGSAGTLMQEAA